MNIDKKYVEKKHRVLDTTDLNDINNTFEKIDITFKSIEKTLNNKFELFKTELKHSREVTDSKIDSLRWVLGFLVAGIVAILIKLFV